MKNKILISTGGSGGHVIPATILCDHLSKENDIIISTDKRGRRFINGDSFKIKIIDTPKLNSIFLLPINFFKIFILIIQSIFFLKKEKINKIFSTGGYMSVPLIIASRFLNLKIYLLEPNLILGRANKYFLSSCEKIFCYTDKIKNFPDNLKKKIVIIDPLIRKNFYQLKKKDNKNHKFTILIVGGSQGARIFDDSIKESLAILSKEFQLKIIHQTSKKNIFSLAEFYSSFEIENLIFDFNDDFIKILEQTDLCITRAGASTLAELSISNIPFIAVPLPTSKDNHQFENANFYEKKKCCWIIDQKIFQNTVKELLRDIFTNKSVFFEKKDNLKKLNYQNSWINVNQKILDNINEN